MERVITKGTPGPAYEELVYAPAIIILSSELYPRKLEIVREYIQNASDAIDSFATIASLLKDEAAPQIKISIQGRSLLIWDNGIGMDEEAIRKLRRIAYSEKKVGREAGYKGIGRLAGAAVARKLVISSTTYGDPRLHRFEFRAGELIDDILAKREKGVQEKASEAIERHTTITALEVDASEHYTMVELRDIDDKYPNLLDPDALAEYIAEMAPVGFSPQFRSGPIIEAKLQEHLADYSPKTIWLSTPTGRVQIFKPYMDEMSLSEPDFIDVRDPANPAKRLAYCWYLSKAGMLAGKLKPAGGKFVVEGTNPAEKKRLAGLAYKLFGFSIGDRSLPLRTLWKKDYTRPLWFSGEIHVVEKKVMPTTDRSDFVDNAARDSLYEACTASIAVALNQRAQTISDNRKSSEVAEKWREKFSAIERQMEDGGLDVAEWRSRKADVDAAVARELPGRKCKDSEVRAYLSKVVSQGRELQQRMEEARSRRSQRSEIGDLARELGMTSQARKVYSIIMGALEVQFQSDKEQFYKLADEIRVALRKNY